MSAGAIVVFGTGSDASIEQWDGHRAPRGIMLRWFLPDLDFPAFGFDVHRAAIPDIPPLPFDDTNAAGVSGKTVWAYGGIVTLSCTTGFAFEPLGLLGRNALVITPGNPVRVRFNGTAWRIQVNAAAIGTGIEVVALVDGVETLRETLDQPNAQVLWRARDVSEIVLRGEGTVSFIGFHLLDDSRFWTHLAHRCLPVHDAGYACGPRGGANEEEEAKMRLPASVAADWGRRFSRPYNALLPALRRLARGDPPAPIPADTLNPQNPTLTAENGSAERALIRIALLDPHVARILGLAYDDPVVLNGQEFAYKVTGIWRGARRDVDGTGLTLVDFLKLLGKAGARSQRNVRGGTAAIAFRKGAIDFSLSADGSSRLEWIAEDENGHRFEGVLDRKERTITLSRVATLRLAWQVGTDPLFTHASWFEADRRTGILPSVYAHDPGAPIGPATVDATVQVPASPSSLASAALDWPLPVDRAGVTREDEVIAYQVGHRLLGSAALANAPATGAASAADVVRPFSPSYLSQASITDAPPRKLYIDFNEGRGLAPGWWGWWVRGVDLFGRVSAPSSWDVGKVVDTAPAPSPVLVQAEWVQRALPAMTIAVHGRSVEAQRWLMATGTQVPLPDAGLVAAWAMPPEQAELRDDVDGFRLFLRKAVSTPSAPVGAPLEYEPWAANIAQFGPLQIVGRGTIVSVTPDPQLAVTLSAGERVPAAPRSPTALASPPLARTAFRTDLALDGASNVFVGGNLAIGGRALLVVANGDGPNLVVVVEHAEALPPPAAGAATLRAATGKLVSFETDVPDLAGVPGLGVRCGLLLDERATPSRFPVLRKIGDEFLCVRPPDPENVQRVAPAPGHVLAWHPVWFASLSDTGFGPVANATTPVANAQVAVQAVRLVQTLGLTSARSATLTVTAVDCEPPPTPTIIPIPFDPADTCTELASRADWYGDSRYTFSWAPQSDCTFTVYRALADEVFRLDREHMRRPAARVRAQPYWPPGVFADAGRRSRVEQELAALDAALATAVAAGAAAAAGSDAADAASASAAAAYDALCNDTQMFLGLQPHTWAAFTSLFGQPIERSSYTDILNGRTRAHWFYAVTARSRAGVESPPSTISPPICCPDVVPPAPPLGHSALAAYGAVKLRWLASPDADTHHYEIHAAREPEAVTRLDTLTQVPSSVSENGLATATPIPHVSGTIMQRFVPRARNEMGDWCFWIIATDTAGNRSEPSRMLRGRALQLPPLPPVWVSATRNGDRVDLVWTYPLGMQGYAEDPRWMCQVERRVAGGTMWRVVSPQLPRAVYLFSDTLTDLESGWDYRLVVTDHLGQIAPTRPLQSVPSAGP